MNETPQDYTHRSWLAATTLIAILVAVSFIPPQSLGSIKLRRANILSELISFGDPIEESADEELLFDDEELLIDMEAVAECIKADSLPHKAETTLEWEVAAPVRAERNIRPDSARFATGFTPIEDYSSDQAMLRFYDTLLHAARPVRIAVLGDSFIEGDILTADLRERMQTAYAGGGTGFAPMASPLTAFRRTVKTQAKGWDTYNIMQYKSTPQALREKFFVSGWVCHPTRGASTRWENTDYRQRLDSCTSARLLFISPSNSRIELIVNDSIRREFTVEGDEGVRQIAVSAPGIHSLSFRLIEGNENFVGYGAIFEKEGVVVDNYSVRSNNGQAMFRTNPSVNAQINAMLHYDLVILQYGLNIMQAGVRNYTAYTAQVEKMAGYIRHCFPDAAILILGVSDRSVKGEQGFERMDAIPYLTEAQRTAARNARTAFWPTSEAMKAAGGMEQFVKNGWAGKDYTHINYAGGRHVAWALFDALNSGVCRLHTRQRIADQLRKRSYPLVNAARRAAVDRRLRTPQRPLSLPKPINPTKR